LGCEVCNHTGFLGRIGIFEILEMEEDIKEMVIKRASSSEIMVKAKAHGMKTMLNDGIIKAINGVTTLMEVIKVAQE
jgi:type II secretory ATPase GspE/PulE/Tfp pilus assembly ATPase PilB-like protein